MVPSTDGKIYKHSIGQHYSFRYNGAASNLFTLGARENLGSYDSYTPADRIISTRRNFTSKTYETPLFSKISIVHTYYVTHNDFGTVLKLIDCNFRKEWCGI